MVKLSGMLSHLSAQKILVVGDLLLDTYTIGKAKRISPEAPVAVVHVQKEEHRPGGAGNVILNLISLGAEVVALGRVGDDPAGLFLRQAFVKEGVDIRGLFTQGGYATPVKNRVIADNQQIVRIDHETITPLAQSLEQTISQSIPLLMEDVKVVALSDYGKGFLSHTLLASIIKYARSQSIPIIADPKGVDFTKYAGSTVIKPNLSEAYTAAGMTNEAPLELIAEKILQLAQCDTLMITRSEQGISLFHQHAKRQDFPVRIQEVKDVTGAGDTVLAILAYALSNGLNLGEAAQLANVAAGIAIERLGCARVTLGDLARRLLLFDAGNKVFDEEHVSILVKALDAKNYIVLNVSGENGLTSFIFSTIRQLAQIPNCDLLVFVRDLNPSQEFIDILAALHDVDFIFLSSEGLKILTSQLQPSEFYCLAGNCLTSEETVSI